MRSPFSPRYDRILRVTAELEAPAIPLKVPQPMRVDILFVAKNRLEFTRESLAALVANTNWDLVRVLRLWDDGSTDGTYDLLRWPGPSVSRFNRLIQAGVSIVPIRETCGSPAAIMNAHASMLYPADVFAKIDNDTIVPPGWLDVCVAVMTAHPELDLLGIEPPASRTPHYEGGKRMAAPEEDYRTWQGAHYESYDRETGSVFRAGYASCDSIGGIGLMRTRAFLQNGPLKPHSTYGGFTEWQLEHPRVSKGWIVPPLGVFLLDRLPFAPWSELSKQYETKCWQREWSKYPKDSTLWKWWTPVVQMTHA